MQIRRFQTVEVVIPTGASARTFQFPDQPNLRNALIWRVELYPATVITSTPVNQLAPLAVADMQRGSLTLTIGSSNDIQQVPLIRLNTAQASTTPYYRDPLDFEGILVSWDKCRVEFTQTVGTTGVAVCFGVYYTLKGDDLYNGYNILNAM